MDNEIIVNGITYVRCSIMDFANSDNTIVVEVGTKGAHYMEKPKPKPFEFELTYMGDGKDRKTVVTECIKGRSVRIGGRYYWVSELEALVKAFINHPR